MNPAIETATHPEGFGAAVRHWELRRILYNVVLSAVAIGWVVATWPHFLPAFTMSSVLPIGVLALLANLCYCAAYPAEMLVQLCASSGARGRWRLAIWITGTLLAVVLEYYWIGDEIYPYVPFVK